MLPGAVIALKQQVYSALLRILAQGSYSEGFVKITHWCSENGQTFCIWNGNCAVVISSLSMSFRGVLIKRRALKRPEGL